MQTIIVMVCLGLLLWIEPACAKDYPLKVSVHQDLLTNKKDLQALTNEVDSLLLRASMRLKGRCDFDITFSRNGPIEPFTSAPSIIKTPEDLEAVHSVPADVKIIKEIKYCTGNPPWVGCSFRPDVTPGVHLNKTMIVPGPRS